MVTEISRSSILVFDVHLQSKEKFLSAASSDGFGFCSVILYAVLIQRY